MIALPKILLNSRLLVNSGFTAEEYPLLHAISTKFYPPMVVIVVSTVFLWTVMSLRPRTVKYQIKRIGFATIISLLALLAGLMHSKVALTAGRWWYTFPFFSIAMNDAAAYFCGMSCGRRKLIGLSPNKTLEGFIGAFFVNIIFTA